MAVSCEDAFGFCYGDGAGGPPVGLARRAPRSTQQRAGIGGSEKVRSREYPIEGGFKCAIGLASGTPGPPGSPFPAKTDTYAARHDFITRTGSIAQQTNRATPREQIAITDI